MAKIVDTANTLTSPEWLGVALEPWMMVPAGGKLDASQFYAQDSVLVTVTGTAAQNATSVPVTALSGKIPSGTVLYFGGQKVATLTADAAAAATSLTVAALPTALAAADTARYAGTMKVAVQAGTLVGRTIAERDANTGYGPGVVGSDDELYLVVFDKMDLSRDNDVDLLKASKLITVYENMLPGYLTGGWNTASNEVQTVTINGSLSAGVILIGDGKGKTVSMAYNANQSAIQTAYDTLYGASKVVIAGTVASYTVTFSGTGVAGIDQTLGTVDGSNATGFTSATVVETIKGGKVNIDWLRQNFNVGVSYN